MAAMAVLTAGMLIEYYMEQDRIERARNASDDIRTARVREEIHATYEHPGIRLENTWGGDTSITGIIVVCDSGAILRAPFLHHVPAGASILVQDVPDAGACT